MKTPLEIIDTEIVRLQKERKKVLVINGLSESGKYSFYGNISMRWLENKNTRNTLLISNKGKKINETLHKFNNRHCFDEVMTFTEYFQEKSWKKAIKVLETKRFEKHFDEVNVYSFFENLPTLENLHKKIKEDDAYKHNFSQRLLEYRKYYLINYLSKHFKIKHYVIDPLEQEINNSTRYYFYDTPNHKYSPFMMYSLFMGKSKNNSFSNLFEFNDEKDTDFIFGVTSFTYKGIKNWRDDFLRDFLQIDFSDINAKTYITSRKLERQEFIDKELYDAMQKKSKFTLVIPSNNPNHFSLIRFYEALTNDCIPLVLDTNQYEQAFTNDKQILKIVKENLIVSLDNLKAKMKAIDFTSVLYEIQNTDDYKKYLSESYYQNYT